jgi:hypothetical protein
MIRNLYVRHRRPVVFDILGEMRAFQPVEAILQAATDFFRDRM